MMFCTKYCISCLADAAYTKHTRETAQPKLLRIIDMFSCISLSGVLPNTRLSAMHHLCPLRHVVCLRKRPSWMIIVERSGCNMACMEQFFWEHPSLCEAWCDRAQSFDALRPSGMLLQCQRVQRTSSRRLPVWLTVPASHAPLHVAGAGEHISAVSVRVLLCHRPSRGVSVRVLPAATWNTPS